MPSWIPGRVLLPLLVMFAPLAAAPTAAANQNAADYYRRAFIQIEGISRAQIDRLLDWADGDPSQPLTPEMRASLAAVSGALNNFRRGAAAGYSDFGLDYSQGFELLIPHAGQMRTLTRLAYADTLARVRDGDVSGALRNTEAMVRSAVHLTDDGVMISSLVGSAMYSLTDQLFGRLLDEGALNAADAAQLLRAMDSLSDKDPFRLGETIAFEQSMFSDWIDGKFEESESVAELLGGLVGLDPADPRDNAYLEQFGSIDRGDLDELLSGYDRAMSAGADAFMLDDRDAAFAMLDQLSEDLRAGEYGPLATLMIPSISHLLRNRFRMEDMVSERRQVLEELAQGLLLPGDLINAAAEYLAAAARLENLDDDLRREIDTPEAELSPETEEEWGRLREALRLATTRRKCDFAPYRPHSPVLFAADALALRDLFLALVSDARRGLRQGDDAGLQAAADSVLTQLGMIVHLSRDDQLAMALVTREAAMRLKDLVASLAGNSKTKAAGGGAIALAGEADGRESALTCGETWLSLRSATDRLPRSSPFGLSRAAGVVRAALAQSTRHCAIVAARQRAEDGGAEATEVSAADAVAPIDRPVTEQVTLFAMLDLHWRRFRSSEESAEEPARIVERMVPIFEESAYQWIRSRPEFEHEYQLLAHFAASPVGDPQIAVLAPVESYIADARRDLRGLVLAVRAASAPYVTVDPDAGEGEEEDRAADESSPS